MSFNRLNNDICEQKRNIRESTGPGFYQINTPVLCNTCFQENPQIINQRGGVSMHANTDWRFYNGPVQIESELYNITRPNTRCPEGKYVPKCPNCGTIISGQPCGDGVSKSCPKCKSVFKKGGMCNDNLVDFPDCHFPIENTRLSNPPSTLRGTGWNRFEDLCLDPQDQIIFPGEYHIPTRLVFRDNFRPCIRKSAINTMHPLDLGLSKPDKCKLNISNSRYGRPLFLREDRCK